MSNYEINIKPSEVDPNGTKYSGKTNKLPSGVEDYSIFVTPEMFGAVGDGVADDSSAFIQMFNSNLPIILSPKTYCLNSIDGFNVTNLKISGNGATIKCDNLSLASEFAIIVSGSGYIDSLNVYKNTNNKIFGFIGCNNYKLTNCCFESSTDNDRGFIDLYENNHYFVIDSCDFNLFSTSLGGMWVRGSHITEDLVTDHIIITNCNFLHCGKDECLAIWGGNGIVKDVIIDNCVFEDYGDATHGWLISLGQSNGSVENITMRNCMIVSNKTTSGVIYNNSNGSKNIIIDKTKIVSNSDLKNGIIYADDTTVYDSYIKSTAKGSFIARPTTKLVGCFVEYIGHTPKIYSGNLDSCEIIGDLNSQDAESYFCINANIKNTVFKNLVMSRFAQTLNENHAITLDSCELYNCNFTQSQVMLIGYANKLNIKNCLLPYPIRLGNTEAYGCVIGNYFKTENAFTGDNNGNVVIANNNTSVMYE